MWREDGITDRIGKVTMDAVVHGLLDEAAEKSPDALALVDDCYELTYADWRRISLHLAKGLQSMGVRKGDIVGAYVGKNFLLPVLFTAVSRIGAQFMALVPGWPEQTRERTFDRWQRKFVVMEEDERWSDMELPDCDCWRIRGESVLEGAEVPYSLPEVSSDDAFYLNVTSASTGLPKVASTTHARLLANTAGVCEALDLGRDDVHLSLFGVIGHPHEIFMRGLFLGGKTVLTESPYPRTIIQKVSAYGVTTLMGLPPQFEGIARLCSRADADLGSLRFGEAGGMHFSDDFSKRFRERTGVGIVPVWGSTETSGVVLAGEPSRSGFTRVVPGYEIELRSVGEGGPDEEPTQPGAAIDQGELWVRGRGVVESYHGDRVETQQSFRDGWYRTGDLFRREGDGRLVFLGRRGGLIKSAGLKVYPLEVELALLKHPDVADVCVVGTVHPSRGEVPAAYTIPRPGSTLSAAQLRQFLRPILAEHKVPRIFHMVAALPRTPNGKIDRKAVGNADILPDYRGEILRTDVELVRLLNHRVSLLEAIEGGFDPAWVQNQVENAVGHNPGPMPDSLVQEIFRYLTGTLEKR